MKKFIQLKRKEKLLIISLSLIFGSFSPILCAYGIWFQKPIIKCFNNKTPKFICNEKLACSKEFSYKIDYNLSPKSLVTMHNLLCERREIQRKSITLVFSGAVIGAFIPFIINFNSKRKHYFIGISALILSFCCFINTLFNNIYIISFSLFLVNLIYGVVNVCTYSYPNEVFNEELASFVIIAVNFSFGILGGIYAFISYLFQSNFNKIMLFSSITSFPIAIIFLLNFPSKIKDNQVKKGITLFL